MSNWAETLWLKTVLTAGSDDGGTVVNIVQIPNNKYGFNIQLYDVDGKTPLNDVVMTGVSDITSELRTNRKGTLKFFSDAAKHTVKFSGYPSHLDDSMFPTSIQGYINDLSEIVVKPDASKYYGYQITVKDSSGSILANHDVYSDDTKLGTTNSSGIFTVYSSASSLNFVITNGAKYYNGTISGTLGGMKTTTVTINNNPYTGTLDVGNTITFIGKEWLVVNKTANQAILARNVIESETTLGASSKYSESTIASAAKSYENSFIGVNKTLINCMCPETTVNGVTARIFVPSVSQVNGGFAHFNSNENRICQYNGRDHSWWTSSEYTADTLYYIDENGALYYGYQGGANYSHGFRPFVAFAL